MSPGHLLCMRRLAATLVSIFVDSSIGSAQTQVGASAASIQLEVDRKYPLSVTQVRGTRELSDGRVIVLLREPRTMVIFDAAGRTQRQLGRTGDGPGEYRSPKAIFPMGGDSSLVVDGTNRKFYLIDRDRFGSITSAVQTWQPILSSGVDVHGTMLQMVGVYGPDNPREPWQYDDLPIYAKRIALVLRPRNAQPQTIDTIAGQYFGARQYPLKVNRVAMIHIGILNPLQTHDQAVMFATGDIAIARFSPYRVDWRLRNGTFVKGTPVSEPANPVTAEVRKRFAENWMRNDDGTPVLKAEKFPPWPAVVPPFVREALVAGTDGLLYVTRTRSTVGEKLAIDAFDSTGKRVGSALLPEGSRLLAVTPRGWYVAQRNEDDEETLVRYRRVN